MPIVMLDSPESNPKSSDSQESDRIFSVEEIKRKILEGRLPPDQEVIYQGERKKLCNIREVVPIAELVRKYLTALTNARQEKFENMHCHEDSLDFYLPWCHEYPFWEQRLRALDASVKAMIQEETSLAQRELKAIYVWWNASNSQPDELIQLINHNLAVLHLMRGDLQGLYHLLQALYCLGPRRCLKETMVVLGEVVLVMYRQHRGTVAMSALAKKCARHPRVPSEIPDYKPEEVVQMKILDEELRWDYLCLAHGLWKFSQNQDPHWEDMECWPCPITGKIRKASALALVFDMSLYGDVLLYALHRGTSGSLVDAYEWLARVEKAEGIEKFRRWFEFIEKALFQQVIPECQNFSRRLTEILNQEISDIQKKSRKVKDGNPKRYHFLDILAKSMDLVLDTWESHIKELKKIVEEPVTDANKSIYLESKDRLTPIEKIGKDAQWLEKLWDFSLSAMSSMEKIHANPVAHIEEVQREANCILASVPFSVSAFENPIDAWSHALWHGMLGEGLVKAGLLHFQKNLSFGEIYFREALRSVYNMDVLCKSLKECISGKRVEYLVEFDPIIAEAMEFKISHLIWAGAILQKVEREQEEEDIFQEYRSWIYGQIKKIYECELNSLHLLGKIGRLQLTPLNITLDALHLNDDLAAELAEHIQQRVAHFLGFDMSRLPQIRDIRNMLQYRCVQLKVAWELTRLCLSLNKCRVAETSPSSNLLNLLSAIFYTRLGWEYLEKCRRYTSLEGRT